MTEEQRYIAHRIVNEFVYYFDGIGGLYPPLSGNDNLTTFIMGVTKLDYEAETNILNVWLRRPGLLIGKGGETLEKVQTYIGCDIHVKEDIITKIEIS